MDPLSFIGKLIGVTARVGAAFAIGAVALFFFRRAGIEPFVSLAPSAYQATLVAGLVGGGTVAVEFLVALRHPLNRVFKFLSGLREKRSKKKENKRNAEKNLQSMPGEFVDVLIFLKDNNWKRFPETADNRLLRLLVKSFLLEIDDPNYDVFSPLTYYVVPDHVWSAIDNFGPNLRDRPVPQRPPWQPESSPYGWMR